ncbi:putative host attachment protein [Pseudomonas phage phiZ98]|nr:putative host attachment protein [Pseudomonas phage phiZ98]
MAPGNPTALVTGRTLNLLRSVAGEPQYHKGAAVTGGWLTEADGSSPSITSFEQRHGKATVSFVDANRFISELQGDEGTVTRRPCMPRLIHVPGEFVASTSPLANDLTAEEDQLGNVLRQAGFFAPAADFFKLPCYVYRFGGLSIRNLFGDDFAPLFEFAKMFRRYGAGELILQALQHDSDKRHLMSMSDMVGVKVEAGVDELSMIMDALEVGTLTELGTVMEMVNAMTAIRQAKVLNTSQDEAGVGMTFYYAMMDGAYLASMPLDLVQAFGAGGEDGMVNIRTVAGAEIPVLQAQLPPEMRVHIPTLRAITAGHYEVMQKARVLYRMMLVVRFLEYKGYPLDVNTTLAQSDRRQFFELLL